MVGAELATRGVTSPALLSGTLRRQRDSADLMAEAAGWDGEAGRDPGWNEYDHRAVLAGHKRMYRSFTMMKADLVRTGRPYAAFDEMYARAIETWVSGHQAERYPEPYAVFCARVDAAFDRVASTSGHDATVVIATSAGVISRIVARTMEAPPSTWVRLERTIVNGSVTTLRIGARGVHLVTLNEHRHLLLEPGLFSLT